MTKLHHEIEINAPVERVWKVLADLETVQYYNPMVTKARYISLNRGGIGAARQCDFKLHGSGKERMFEWEPEKVIGIELYEHNWPVKIMRWWTKVRPDGNSTFVTQDLEYETKFGVLGTLMNALMMRRKLDGGISEVFEGLKKFVEK